MMKTIYHIIIKEFLQLRRDRRMLILSFLAPVVQLMLLGYAATTDVKEIPMLICDQDQTSKSRDLVNQFVNSGYFVIREEVHSPNEIDQYIEEIGRAHV
jgi:ABC-2 type transport system permease protein